MNQGPVPPGPPPPGPAARTRPRTGPLVVAAAVGLVVGVGGSVVVAMVTPDDDLDRACSIVEELDGAGGLAGGREVSFQVAAAGNLFVAEGGGDFDTEPGQLGQALQGAVARFDEPGLDQAIADAEDYCGQG